MERAVAEGAGERLESGDECRRIRMVEQISYG